MKKKKDYLYKQYGNHFMSTGDLTKFNIMFKKQNVDEHKDGADDYLEDLVHQSLYPLSKKTKVLKQNVEKKIPFELGIPYRQCKTFNKVKRDMLFFNYKSNEHDYKFERKRLFNNIRENNTKK